MEVAVNKSEVKGKVRVPASKSQTIRALMCAALARGESEIIDPLISEDTEAAAEVLGKVGIKVTRGDGVWKVQGGTFRVPEGDLYCGESATTLRFMTAICALVPGQCRLTGGPSLSLRPVKSLVEALKKLGVKCYTEGKTTPPVVIEGGTLKGGIAELPGNISSQFISALLLVAPLAEKDVNIRLTTELTSRSYVLMTLRCLRKFGINVTSGFDKFVVTRQKYQPVRFEVEGDWSSASYFLALGAFSDGIEIENLSTMSLQGDRIMLDFLRSMGALVRVSDNSVTVSRGHLKAIQADFYDCIDLLPTMSVLAGLADGTSDFAGVERARIKESNRVAAVREGLEKLGVTVVEQRDRMTITGLTTEKKASDTEEDDNVSAEESREAKMANLQLSPVNIDSYNDHRIAMSFGVLGTVTGGVTISQAECVAKTFPQFWDILQSIGGEIEISGQ
jgi:3-phosphoshikimate 1-carboxyvinyltransferase